MPKAKLSKRRRVAMLGAGGAALIGLSYILAAEDVHLPIPEVIKTPSPQEQQAQPLKTQDEEGQPPEDFVDPREVKSALQDIQRLKNELKRFTKQFQKLPNTQDDIKKVNDLLADIQTYENNIKKPPDGDLRSAMQDFWDARMWEQVDEFRAKIELPKQLKELDRDLKRVEKMIQTKSFQKLGFDMEALKNNVAQIRASYDEAKAKYESGALQEAMEALEPIHEGGHPGEVMSLLFMMRDVKQRMKIIRDKDILVQVEEVVLPIIELANEGDFREARQYLEEIQRDLFKLIDRAANISKGKGSKAQTLDLLQKLEDTIRAKSGSTSDEKDENEKERD